jgi:flagellar hook-associated protein 1 FlgK
MGITTAISIALSGLKNNQTETELVSRNIANADTAGYTAKRLVRSDVVQDQSLIGVKAVIQRQVDAEVTRQLNNATAATGYLDTMSTYLKQIDGMLGSLTSGFSLSDLAEKFTEKMQTLSASPDNQNAQIAAVQAASDLASGLNQLASDTQDMRTGVEQAIGDGVSQVNTLLKTIATYNSRIISNKAAGIDTTELEDARDASINSLSGWMDVKTYATDSGGLYVYSGSGMMLVGSQAAQLNFDQRGTLSASATWSANADDRAVGTITLASDAASSIDLIRNGTIQSGKLAALIELRDTTLVNLQAQLDDVASALAQTMSDTTVAGTAATDGSHSGYALDVGDVKAGNSFSVTVKNAAGQSQVYTFVRVDNAATLPLSDSVTGNPNDKVVGIDWSSGDMNAIAAQVQAALGSGVTASAAGTTLTVLGAGTGTTVAAASVTTTQGAVQTAYGDTAMALFVDGSGNKLYTGSVDGSLQKTGFAQRITLNSAITADPSLLVKYTAATESGDTARPTDLAKRLASMQFSFGDETGMVSKNGATTGTLDSFINTMTSFWGAKAENAASALDSQSIIQSNLETRYSDKSSVNIDQEMARLIQIQSAYAANARVFTVCKEMLDTLLKS